MGKRKGGLKGTTKQEEETIDNGEETLRDEAEDRPVAVAMEMDTIETVVEEVPMDTDIYDDEGEHNPSAQSVLDNVTEKADDVGADSDNVEEKQESLKGKSDSLQEKVQAMQQKVSFSILSLVSAITHAKRLLRKTILLCIQYMDFQELCIFLRLKKNAL